MTKHLICAKVCSSHFRPLAGESKEDIAMSSKGRSYDRGFENGPRTLTFVQTTRLIVVNEEFSSGSLVNDRNLASVEIPEGHMGFRFYDELASSSDGTLLLSGDQDNFSPIYVRGLILVDRVYMAWAAEHHERYGDAYQQKLDGHPDTELFMHAPDKKFWVQPHDPDGEYILLDDLGLQLFYATNPPMPVPEPVVLPSHEGDSFRISLVDGQLVGEVVDERDGAEDGEARLEFVDNTTGDTHDLHYNVFVHDPCADKRHSFGGGPICQACGHGRKTKGEVPIEGARFTEPAPGIRVRRRGAFDSLPEDVVFLTEDGYVRIERHFSDWARLHYRDGALQIEVLSKD